MGMVVRYTRFLDNIYYSTISCKCTRVLTKCKVVIVYMLYILGLEPRNAYALILKRLYHNRQAAGFIQ